MTNQRITDTDKLEYIRQQIASGKLSVTTQPNTLHGHTMDETGGRYRADLDRGKPVVVGATPNPPRYAAANWAADPTGVEQPLGVAIDDQPTTGEYFEVQQSIERKAKEQTDANK